MYRRPTVHSDNVAIDDKIGSSYEDVKIVADNIDAVIAAADGIAVTLKYLGAHSAPPTERLDGNPIENGDYYFDTTDGEESLVYYDLADNSWFKVDPQAVLDAAAAAELARDEAQAAATTATTKATEASTSATNAANSEAIALQAHLDAVTAKDLAEIAAVNAAISETNAGTSEVNAANSASAASTSETNAGVSETNASNSAIAASNSETSASDSAASASTSATSASTSASNASTSETNAAASELAAGTSATSASTSETNAALSETNAATSESNAATSETNARTSEINADDAASIAAANANYKGEWSALTGALNIPASVKDGNTIYMLNTNLADVTLSKPADNPSDWFILGIVGSAAPDSARLGGELPEYYLNPDNHDDTATVNKWFSEAERTKLSDIATGAQVNTVNSVSGKQGDVLLDKSDVNLGGVDNTSDVDKPVSNPQQAALDLKTDTSRTINGKALTSDIALVADDINDSASVNKWSSTAEKTKLGNISVTQPVDLDTLESDVATNNAKVTNVSTNLGYNTATDSGTVTSSDGTNATIPAATNSIAGLQTSTDKAKLDGIEAGATADQSAVEIKTAYESNNDTNVFTDAEKAKLANVDLAESLAIVRDSKATSGDDVFELAPFITPATVANQFSIPATVKYVDGLRIAIPESVVTLPAAPDGLDKLDGTGRYVDLTAAVTAGGTGLTQSVITRQDVVVYDVNQAKYSVHQGLREYSGMVDAMTAFGYTQDAKDKNLWRDALGNLFVIICHPQRLNQGGYHPEYNSSGCSSFWNADNVSNTGWLWHASIAKKPANKSECFALSATNGTGNFVRADRGDIAGGISGRPTSWETQYHDAIYASLTHDVRASCNRRPESDMLIDAARDIEADDIRGKESVPFTNTDLTSRIVDQLGYDGVKDITFINATTWSNIHALVGNRDNPNRYAGAAIQGNSNTWYPVTYIGAGEVYIAGDNTADFTNGTNHAIIYIEKFLSSQFETLPYQDIIGDPARIAATFPDGVYGSWITTIPNGGALPYSREYQTGSDAVYTSTNGAAWTAIAISSDTILNENTNNFGWDIVALLPYSTKANPLTLANNSKVVGGISTASALQHHTDTLVSHLISKVATGNTAKDRIQGLHLDGYTIDENGLLSEANEYQPTHRVIDLLNGNSPAVKVFYRLAIRDGQYCLQLCAKEMSWDVTSDHTGEFVVISGSDTSAKTVNTKYFVSTSTTGKGGAWVCVLATSLEIDHPSWTLLPSGEIATSDGTVFFKRWDGNGWGDSEKFSIHDGESTEPDENGNTVISVLKEVALPHFTGEDE